MTETFLTAEQAKQIDRKAERAAQKVLRNYRRSATVGFVLLLLVAGGERYIAADAASDARKAISRSANFVAVQGCNRDFKDRAKLHAIMRRGRDSLKQFVSEGTITQAQYEREVKRSKQEIRNFPLPDCRPLAQSISDNPEANHHKPPKALYPKPRKGG